MLSRERQGKVSLGRIPNIGKRERAARAFGGSTIRVGRGCSREKYHHAFSVRSGGGRGYVRDEERRTSVGKNGRVPRRRQGAHELEQRGLLPQGHVVLVVIAPATVPPPRRGASRRRAVEPIDDVR